jgi:hypothetical protein
MQIAFILGGTEETYPDKRNASKPNGIESRKSSSDIKWDCYELMPYSSILNSESSWDPENGPHSHQRKMRRYCSTLLLSTVGKRKGLKSMAMNRLHHHHPGPSAAPKADVMVSYFEYITIHSFSCFFSILTTTFGLIWRFDLTYCSSLNVAPSSLFLHLYVTW